MKPGSGLQEVDVLTIMAERIKATKACSRNQVIPAMTVIMPARRQTNGQWPGRWQTRTVSNGMVGRMAIGGWHCEGSYAADPSPYSIPQQAIGFWID